MTKGVLNKNIIYAYIIILLAFIVWCIFSPYEKLLTISFAQYVICLLAFLFLFTIKSVRENIFFKKAKYIFPLILLMLFLSEYFNLFQSKKEILFSRFPQDELEIISSRSRDIINKRIKDNSLRVKRAPFLIQNKEEAKEHLKEGYDVVIWKEDNYINLSFKQQKNVRIKGVLSDKKYIVISDISELKVPSNTHTLNNEQDIKRFRNTYNDPILAPSIFISNLLYKLKEDEIKLKEIYYQKFLWKQSSHLAYPYFLIGTKHLKNYGKEGEIGELFCAINDYKKALMYIRKSDENELYFAIINNLMVAYSLGYEATRKPIYKRKARAVFKRAFPTPKYVSLKDKLIFLKNRNLFLNNF